MASATGNTRRTDVILGALHNHQLLRVLAAFLIFNTAWWANWIAVLVWAYGWGGVRAASGIALAQLVPSAVLATPAAALFGRWRRTQALVRGYVVQTLTYLTLAGCVTLGAPVALTVVAIVLGALAVTLTRPVHYSLLPEISATTGDLTVGTAASGTLEATGLVVGPLVCSLTIVAWGPGGVVLLMTGATAGAVLATTHLVPTMQVPTATLTPADRASSQLLQVLADPGARVLTVLVAAESTLIGMIDILVVVLALDLLALPDSGPGVLNCAIGTGGLVGAAFTFMLVGHRRLGVALILAGLLAGLPLALAGFSPSLTTAALLLLLCGAGKAFFEVTARTLLQRLLPDRLLTAVFGLQESMMMAGFAAGSLAAPLLVAAAGPGGAFVSAGLFLPVVTVGSWSLVRRLDAAAAVPQDVLALLQEVPMLSVLTPRIVERLAREAVAVTVGGGARLTSAGEPGDTFFVIADGEVLVTSDGRPQLRLGTGDWFGEVSLLSDVRRTSSVVSVNEVALWALDRSSFLTATAGSPHLAQSIDEGSRL